MNYWLVTGNLTGDPELRHTSSGKAVTRFGLAVDRRFNRAQADYFDVDTWQDEAELCARYLRKGRQIAAACRIEQRLVRGEDGVDRKIYAFIADKVDFLDKPNS